MSAETPASQGPAVREVHDGVVMLVARPQGAVRARVVVLPEIWGLSPFVAAVCADLAARGCAVAAPALYVVDGPDVAADKDTAFARLATLDDAVVRSRVQAAAAALGGDAPLVVIGYCLGGRCALQVALDLPKEVAAAVALGPTGLVTPMTGKLTPLVDRCGDLGVPTLLVVGDDDPYLPLADLNLVQAAAGTAPLEVLVCAGAGHGFHNPLRPGFRAGPAAQATARVDAFLARWLGEATP